MAAGGTLPFPSGKGPGDRPEGVQRGILGAERFELCKAGLKVASLEEVVDKETLHVLLNQDNFGCLAVGAFTSIPMSWLYLYGLVSYVCISAAPTHSADARWMASLVFGFQVFIMASLRMRRAM